MQIDSFKLETLRPPKDDLQEKIRASALTLENHDVIALSSKVVSIGEGRCIPMAEVSQDELITREADQYLERSETPGGFVLHTLKQGTLIPNAGIDPFGEHYILWPEDPQKSAESLLAWFKKTYQIEHLYLIITDSRSVLLRRGVVGIAIAWAGFEPVYDNRVRTDLLGNPSAGSQTNIPDALAAAAVYAMGEANEGTPLVRIRNAPYLKEAQTKRKEEFNSYTFLMEEDIFAPFLTRAPWKKD